MAEEAKGRTNAPGAGRKPILGLGDPLLMTMMRLCLGRLQQELAYRFGFSTSCVSRTTLMWLNFSCLRLGLTPILPRSLSDCQLFQHSAILYLLDDIPEGKSLMAGVRLKIQRLLIKCNLLLNIPPFKGTQKNLSQNCPRDTKKSPVCDWPSQNPLSCFSRCQSTHPGCLH